ncbi:MAG TPA: glycosyl hydrolase family 28-related protein [Chthoniobacteraceae bacterium]|nr:glycosyl hydrolase family 28-related protein [Chthoniobacteraceae bacterium]
MRKILLPLCALFFLPLCICRADEPKPAFADGVTDATAPIQQLLDAKKAAGGTVNLPPGQYLIKGSLRIPSGVTLKGSWDAPHHGNQWQKGTTLLITGGEGAEEGPAAIELEGDASAQGLTMAWPTQDPAQVKAFPWAIRGHGHHDTVEDVTLMNAYQGIKMGGDNADGSLHLIRNVFGCVLRRGVMVDNTTDIGRIENVHFNPHYWLGSGHPSAGHDNFKNLSTYLTTNLEGFIFARSDWEYVENTFIWGAKSGYLFIKTKSGNCNGQFMGIGADFCKACVQVDNIQPYGLLITNGEFTAFAGDPNAALVTSPGAGGAVQLVNCSFWDPRTHCILMQGDTAVTLSDSHIAAIPADGAIIAGKGKLIVKGCVFDSNKGPAVVLKSEVKAAIIAENLQPGGVQIDNGIGSRAVIGLNQAKPEAPSPAPASSAGPQPAATNPAPPATNIHP